jgi:lysophospholipase L1-like esterase
MRLGLVAFIIGALLTFGYLQSTPRPVLDVALPKALTAGPLRMTVFGTSLSAPPQTWPDALAAQLATCWRSPVVMTRVVGLGMGSAWALDQVEQVRATKPDLILVEFAINDADIRDGASVSLAYSQHRTLLSDLKLALPQASIVLMTMNPAQGPRGWLRPRLAAHYGQYPALARAAGAGLADIYPRWLALPRAARGLQADGLHPDPKVAQRSYCRSLGRVLIWRKAVLRTGVRFRPARCFAPFTF